MLFKQFANPDYREFIFYFVKMKVDTSEYKDGPNLFGGMEYMANYTSTFKLELIK